MNYAIEAKPAVQWTGSNEAEIEALSGWWSGFGVDATITAVAASGVLTVTVVYYPNNPDGTYTDEVILDEGDWFIMLGGWTKISNDRFSTRFIIKD